MLALRPPPSRAGAPGGSVLTPEKDDGRAETPKGEGGRKEQFYSAIHTRLHSGVQRLQVYLTHKKQHPPRTLQ